MRLVDPDFWFRLTMALVIFGVGFALVAALIGWSIAFVRGALHADVADATPLPDRPSRSGTADRAAADVPAVSDVSHGLAWMGSPRRPANGSRAANVAPYRARKDR